MSMPSYQLSLALEHRESMRGKLLRFFHAHLGAKVSSRELHWKYGSSVRTRISEINNDSQAGIVIRNEYFFDQEQGKEISFYWSEARSR